MIITCNKGNLRLENLAKKVADLILSGVSTGKILILTPNSFKKDELVTKINSYIFNKV